MEINSLIQNVQNNCDAITNFGIEFLSHVSRTTGISYGELNVYLFLVIYPLVLILFILASLTNKKKFKRILILTGFSIIGIIFFLGVFFMTDAILVANFEEQLKI
ncbi:hypothetical protein AB9N12_18020 [Bacteroides sp. AN502(2024)]|uniref:hypothetical protein n=1 Tax=Bacteroides sp. AN502(2024) TaxID=3160599 RepID=UPI0035128FCA